ncbi:MAG TPA: hypothetical protein VES66_10800 [Terriglobales bacterium]|nr:hypothetical protein [Terriglobales bacterium]
MRVRSVALAVMFALAAVLPVMAQDAGKVAEIHINRVKPGMTAQYETGRKKHMAWHKSQKDTWSWYTWEVLTGEGTGSYVVGTFQHHWKHFDGREKFNQADSADAQANMGASLASEQMSYYLHRADLSGGPEAFPPATKLISVTHFMVRPDGVNDFLDGVKKVGEAIGKTNYPQAGPSHWYQLVNGGDVPHFVLVGERATWASFQSPEKPFDAMMEEAYGKEQGAAILASLRKAIRSVYTEALQYRPDLSYVAGK